MKTHSTLLLTLLALAASACGAKSGGEKSPAGGPGTTMTSNTGCPSPNEVIDPTAVIDDFEDGDANLPAIGGRNGGWWTAGDATLGASMVPEQTDLSGELAAPELLPKPRCGSHYAMRVTGQGFSDWGAALGAAFAWGTQPNGDSGTVAYDASSRTGIEFWAKIGDTSTNEVRYQVSDVNSEPTGGVCVDNGAVGEQCYDSFGTPLTGLDTTWRHFKIPFGGLSQRNFGLPEQGLATNAVYQLTFNFMTASPFDFWVDDVAFY